VPRAASQSSTLSLFTMVYPPQALDAASKSTRMGQLGDWTLHQVPSGSKEAGNVSYRRMLPSGETLFSVAKWIPSCHSLRGRAASGRAATRLSQISGSISFCLDPDGFCSKRLDMAWIGICAATGPIGGKQKFEADLRERIARQAGAVFRLPWYDRDKRITASAKRRRRSRGAHRIAEQIHQCRCPCEVHRFDRTS